MRNGAGSNKRWTMWMLLSHDFVEPAHLPKNNGRFILREGEQDSPEDLIPWTQVLAVRHLLYLHEPNPHWLCQQCDLYPQWQELPPCEQAYSECWRRCKDQVCRFTQYIHISIYINMYSTKKLHTQDLAKVQTYVILSKGCHR